MALYNYRVRVAPLLSFCTMSAFIWLGFVVWVCLLQLFCTPCAS